MNKHKGLSSLDFISPEKYLEGRSHRLSRLELLADSIIHLSYRSSVETNKPEIFVSGLVRVIRTYHRPEISEANIAYVLGEKKEQGRFFIDNSNFIIGTARLSDVRKEIGYFSIENHDLLSKDLIKGLSLENPTDTLVLQ